MANYTFEDFYKHILSHFTGGLKLAFSIDPNKIVDLKNATYNKDTNKYYLEIEFRDPSDNDKGLESEYVGKEDIN